jgi:lipopolysaccharide/colanic/teichoic acid biosynthesis glycosyltransferase
MRRSLDILSCVLALPVLGIWVMLMTVITRLVSPGPIFFRQERIGFRGRRFKIFKFRTMRVGADTTVHQNHFDHLMKSDTPMVKLDAKGDSRLIPGGWILRASGMDELPQLINVLKGEMSLVGPRPSIPSEFEKYQPSHRERVNALPGLTGLWQVSGKNRTTFEEMIRLDIHYVRNVSLLLNVKIIVLTPWALLVQIYDTRTRRSVSPPVPSCTHSPAAEPQPARRTTAGAPSSSESAQCLVTGGLVRPT